MSLPFLQLMHSTTLVYLSHFIYTHSVSIKVLAVCLEGINWVSAVLQMCTVAYHRVAEQMCTLRCVLQRSVL